jgi:uncharacterized Tic20 family protein
MNDSTLAPVPSSPKSDTGWLLAIAHFGTCFSWFLAPLVVWLYVRSAAPELRTRALAVLLWSLLGTALAAVTCGLAVPVFLVVHVWAGIKELRDEPFEYPLASDFARRLEA